MGKLEAEIRDLHSKITQLTTTNDSQREELHLKDEALRQKGETIALLKETNNASELSLQQLKQDNDLLNSNLSTQGAICESFQKQLNASEAKVHLMLQTNAQTNSTMTKIATELPVIVPPTTTIERVPNEDSPLNGTQLSSQTTSIRFSRSEGSLRSGISKSSDFNRRASPRQGESSVSLGARATPSKRHRKNSKK